MRKRGEVNHSPLNRDSGWIGTGFEKRLGVGSDLCPARVANGTVAKIHRPGQTAPQRAIHLYSQTSSIRRQLLANRTAHHRAISLIRP